MHASILAQLYNGPFDTGGIPWTPEDFLGTTSRQDRITGRLTDRVKTSAIVQASNQEDLMPEFILELIENQKRTVN